MNSINQLFFCFNICLIGKGKGGKKWREKDGGVRNLARYEKAKLRGNEQRSG
jgi:hypothetical protein